MNEREQTENSERTDGISFMFFNSTNDRNGCWSRFLLNNAKLPKMAKLRLNCGERIWILFILNLIKLNLLLIFIFI